MPVGPRLAEFADVTKTLPDNVLLAAARVLRHNLVVALASRALDIPGVSREPWPGDLPRSAAATRIADGRLVPVEQAVLTNSLMMGARAQHDESPRAISHFGSTVTPGLLATSEQIGGVSGRDFLIAMVVGYEIGDRIGGALVRATNLRGFRPTGLFGPIAGAAANAHLRGLRGEAFVSAISLAANMSAGLSETWRAGTDEWKYQTALAARSAYTAAELAALGVRGSAETFEARNGFNRAFAGFVDFEIPTGDLGSRWAIREVILKLYPVCVFNQAAVQQVIELRGRIRGDVSGIVVRMFPADADYPGVDAVDPPAARSAALMSVQICTAIAALRGAVDIDDLEFSGDAGVRDLARRVTVIRDDGVPSHGARVTLITSEGVIEASAASELIVDEERLHRSYAALQPSSALSAGEFDGLLAVLADMPASGTVDDIIRCFGRRP